MSKRSVTIAGIVLIVWAASGLVVAAERTVLSLDGMWEIAEGSMETMPARFDHRVQVPGLVDLAKPPFEEVGVKSAKREAFWYRRTFKIDGPVPAVALLKIHKACYGTRVFLNGELVGDHLPCFTPGYFDLRSRLKGNGAENELVVRVGAFRTSIPDTYPDGWDFEKIKYIPGIYDSVELILTGASRIVRVQIVPDVPASTIHAFVTMRYDGGSTQPNLSPDPRMRYLNIDLAVHEVTSGKQVNRVSRLDFLLGSNGEQTEKFDIPIEKAQLWSPERPFLYELKTNIGTDAVKTRFGMRSFRFDKATGRAILNGRRYFMRGTNVCIYRFFEDPSRGDRPWREEWVRRLHLAFQSMHWNSIRYCIGFPPEAWYRVCDELGFLIQDEFPIWYLGREKWPAALKSDEIAKEYTEWMQERWNHPCVVIWDAQNETVTEETGKAIAAVRNLDLSNRPWDNGWAPPQGPDDPVESHPYMFYNPNFKLADIAGHSAVPSLREGQAGHPIIINEYGWLWLNRDGKPTTLTKKAWENLLGPDATPEQLRYTYARYLAAKTEFWRSHRTCAAVMHFCGLGYSRPDGQTSDHFMDLEKLTLEPHFETYMRNAFAPVGLMIDEWAEELPAGEKHDIPVIVINDLYTDWKGTVRFRIIRDERTISEQSEKCEAAALGEKHLTFAATVPIELGKYQFVAELVQPGAESVRSLRDFEVLTAEQKAARNGIAVGKPVKSSSDVTVNGETFPAKYAVDGNRSTRWSSEFSDPQWIAVDLGEPIEIARVELVWENAYGKSYAIQVSLDGETWKDVYKTDSGQGGSETLRFAPTKARWVRMYGTKRGTQHGYSLWEIRVFGR